MMELWYSLLSLLPFTWAQADGLLFMKTPFGGAGNLPAVRSALHHGGNQQNELFSPTHWDTAHSPAWPWARWPARLAPTPCAVVFAVVFALLFTLVQRKAHMSSDTVIGVFSSTAVALAFSSPPWADKVSPSSTPF